MAYLPFTSERLRERTVRRLLDFVAESEAAALSDEPAIRMLLVANLGRVIPSDGVMLTGFDAGVQQTVTTATDPRVARLRAREPELWRACLGHHPTVVAFGSTHDCSPLRFSDVLTSRAYHRLPIYAHFFRPCGVEHKIDVRLWPTEHHMDVGCWRERHDFAEQDRAALDALRPYLTVVLRRASRTAITSRLQDAFGLTKREAAVLAVVVRGLRLRDIAHELVIAEGTARKHVEHVYRKLGVSTRGQAIARALDELGATATSGQQSIKELLDHLNVADPLAVYGLTRRESEVLTLIAAGYSNREIATRLGVQPETVKKHLDHVYAKVGVASRGHAAARSLALGLGEP